MRLVSTLDKPLQPPIPVTERRLRVVGSGMHSPVGYNNAIRAVPAPATPQMASSIEELSRSSQHAAYARKAIIEWVLCSEADYGSRSQAIALLLSRAKAQTLPAVVLANLKATCKGKKLPGKSIVHEWVRTWLDSSQSLVAIAPKETGKRRRPQQWDLRCLQLYHLPSKPTFAGVAWQLQQEGFAEVKAHHVNRFISSLPADYGPNSPWRLGKHYYQQNRGRYVSRDKTVLQVGEVYSGDGHTVDCYIAHPSHGGPWRPELTVWIDVRSNYIPGWYLSEAESAHSTLFGLSHALLSQDHVCAWVHIDNGSGYKAKLMSDDSTGFYARFNIATTFAIPGNSKGKGLVENWFHIFRDNHDKFFNGGADYCGHDMAEEVNRRLTDSINQGKRQLRSFEEYRDSVAVFIEEYNHRPQAGLGGKSPADLWAELERVPVELPDAAVLRPMMPRTVRRCTVQLHNRHYEHTNLAQFDAREVRVEYDLHDDSKVWVYDDKGRLICMAPLKTKVAYLPESRLEEQRKKRETGRIKRLQKKMDLVKAEATSDIDHTHQLEALEDYEPAALLDYDDTPDSDITIDLSDHTFFDDSLGE